MNGRTNVTVGTSTDLQIPLDPCASLRLRTGNAQVEITWTDPVDKYATPEGATAQDPQQLVSIWDHTIIVRKVGSPPVGPNDGMVVASSEVRNQYQTTPYIDTGLTNNTTYFYAVYAINQDNVPSEGVYDSAMPRTGTPLSELADGTIIKINENGSPVEYLIVNQGLPSSMYDTSCDGTWLLRKDIYTTRTWDSSNNVYKTSTIHSYLNGTFLNLFDNNIKNAIKQVKIPYVNGTGSGGSVASGANGLSCKIFLLSGYEVGFSTSDDSALPRDGAKLSHFSSGTSSSANNKRIAKYNGSKAYWWLRSPYTSDTQYIWSVSINGSYTLWYHDGTYGVRPALVLPFDILIDDNLNILAYGGKIAV